MNKSARAKLGEWYATAICGNDILSSCLYVSGIAILFAGVYAPLVLVIIALVLFLYKSVYTEIVEALPINGGAYNCLLNGTSKTIAAIAGTTTILSYTATSVISAKIAIEYVNSVLVVPVIPATIALLFFFGILVMAGIKESARVALVIFILHIIALLSFLALGLIFFLHGNSFFGQNIAATLLHVQKDGLLKALFFGFSASLMGISGFESSADFVESQKEGVYRKTLRNMLVGITVFNPLIALAALNISPIARIAQNKEFLLANLAGSIGGQFFQSFIVFDAFLVLGGAVLTAYVGVSGLAQRMASDACLPNFLTAQNKNGSYPRIIISFFLLCTSILFFTHGNILYLAGMYTIAFLSVMSLFALGNLILRQTRTELKRTYTAPMSFVLLALLATLAGIAGNINIDVNNLTYFGLYFIPAVLLVFVLVYQEDSIQMLLGVSRHIKPLHRYLEDHFQDLTEGKLVAFINHADRLYEILEYVNRNENAWNVVLVHCKNHDNTSDMDRYKEIKQLLPHLKKGGVFPHFTIKLVYLNKPFGPQAIEEVSKEFKVRKNRIMIGSIHDFHQFDYADLGGVRIIF